MILDKIRVKVGGIAMGVARFMEGVGQGAKKGTESRAWGDVYRTREGERGPHERGQRIKASKKA